MSSITPQQFVETWRNTPLSERASYQLHFNDICRLVGHEQPSGRGTDSSGLQFLFERAVKKDSGAPGFADVFYENHFAMEYKAPGKYKDLSEAYQQLLQYREKLNNPPLLVVTDIETWEIHTNWPNTEKKIYKFRHEDILNRPSVLQTLRSLFEAPERLHPGRNSEQVTADAARAFELIASNMRGWEAEPNRIAHFLTKLVFCLFAEDVSLLPPGPGGAAGIFAEIIERTRTDPNRFRRYTADLFRAMADGGDVLFQPIPYFNGTLFDDVVVETLSLEALTELARAARLNWQSVEPAIFGTLFERSLDPAKRSQLGAHYTSREDILLIVEPVLMQPLRREWDTIQQQARPIRDKYDAALNGSNRRQITTYSNQLEALREQMLRRLREIRVLDPACGSGNFLYISLQLLMDMEKAVITSELFAGLPLRIPEVHPRQMFGIEKDPIAHALASIVVWIGYLQWQQMNGYATLTRREPILQSLMDNIVCRDAILAFDENGSPVEPDWPAADVIVGNPPFLGGQRLLRELGETYTSQIRALYGSKLHASTDLVTYWFERSRRQIEEHKAKRVGLLATQAIRAGMSRQVLDNIKQTGDIFMAWSDRPWILEGAAVRVSMVGFDDGSEKQKYLDGQKVSEINSNLTSNVDLTQSKILRQNLNLSFEGNKKSGAFELTESEAAKMLSADKKNADVVRVWINGQDVTGRPRNMWIIDFAEMSLEESQQYSSPFNHVVEKVKPDRMTKSEARQREYWWQFARPRPNMREAIKGLSRFIVTPRVAKHRIFTFLEPTVVPDSRLYVIAREDDYFFGVLHSRIHEVWSLATSSRHGVGNDPTYNNTTCFETFPFPWPPGQEDTTRPAYQAISAAAQQLHEERAAWLNPPGMSEKALRHRTLTNLYNALNGWRGVEKVRVQPDAADFAPRLDALHQALDRAVCDAYGWTDMGGDAHPVNLYTPAGEEEILRRLLALNLARAAAG